MSGAKKVRASEGVTPKRTRAMLMARYHRLVDLELLGRLDALGAAKLAEIRHELERDQEAVRLELLEQIRRDRAELRRSMAEIQQVLSRAGF